MMNPTDLATEGIAASPLRLLAPQCNIDLSRLVDSISTVAIMMIVTVVHRIASDDTFAARELKAFSATARLQWIVKTLTASRVEVS